MAIIKPCADLRNNYNEISRICHETKKPVYITKNGANDLVLLSNEAYEEMIEDYEWERVRKKLDEEFDKKYANFEELKKDVMKHVKRALKQIENGEGRPAEEFFQEMEEKYGIHEWI